MQATPLSMHGRSALDAVGMAYAREVYIRNEAKLQGLSHSLVTTFHDASTKFVDKVSHGQEERERERSSRIERPSFLLDLS